MLLRCSKVFFVFATSVSVRENRSHVSAPPQCQIGFSSCSCRPAFVRVAGSNRWINPGPRCSQGQFEGSRCIAPPGVDCVQSVWARRVTVVLFCHGVRRGQPRVRHRLRAVPKMSNVLRFLKCRKIFEHDSRDPGGGCVELRSVREQIRSVGF